MKQIQWYPGHMSKAIREVEEKLKLVDLVVELVDARIPNSSSNPMLNQTISNKPKLIIFTKLDLADKRIVKQWEEYYKEQGSYVLSLDIVSNFKKDLFIKTVNEAVKEKMEKEKKKGLKPRSIKMMEGGREEKCQTCVTAMKQRSIMDMRLQQRGEEDSNEAQRG